MPPFELNDKYTAVKYNRNPIKVFRVTPHASVSNNNKRLWRSIYKMYELYESPASRLERDGFKFTLREKDYFWFDVVFRQKNGKKTVEFYVATSEYQADKLKRKIENKMDVTFSDATLEDLQIPSENTIVQELRYLKHDIFTLNSNSNDTKTPMGSILTALDEIQQDGDIARLSLCAEAENRNKWVKNAQWAYEKAANGKVPQRAQVSGKVVSNYTKVFVATVINELNSLLTDVFQAFQNLFIKSDKNFDKKEVIKKAYAIEDEIGTTRVDRNKGNLPVFKTHIRIAAHSDDRLTLDSLAETLSLSTQDLTETNELHGVKINGTKRERVLNELNTLTLSSQTKYDPNVNLMSTDEMSKLALMLPNRELQLKYADEMNVKKHVETTIPAVISDESNLLIGHAEIKDNLISIGLPVQQKDNFYSGYAMIGKQGCGKDTTIQNFVYGASANFNVSTFVIDWIGEPGHRGMADGIRDLLPPENIIDLDLANEEFIVPMDLTEVISKLGRKGGSRFALEMVDFMQLDGLSRSQKYLTEASKAANGSLLNIKRIIEEEDFRMNRIEELIEEGNVRLARDLMSWGTNDELGNKCDAILNRLNMFFGDDTLYDIFAQPPKEEVDFGRWMREGKTVIIRIPKRKLGNAAKVLAHWITLKVLMTRMLMEQEDKDKHGCFMIFNEPEQVESEGLAKLMGRIATEGRKERLGSIFAFHHWGKLPSYLQDNLIAGGVNQFLFANDHKRTFELAKERLEPTFTIEDALKTPKHHAIAILNTNEPLNAFLVRMLPPVPTENRLDNSFLTKRHARMYGRSWSELQQAL
ncbi:ATP-binding protein [Solibacillus silvestris]